MTPPRSIPFTAWILWIGLVCWPAIALAQTPSAPTSPTPSELMIRGLLSESTEPALREEYASALLKTPAAHPALLDLLKASNHLTTKKILCKTIAQMTGGYLEFTEDPMLPEGFIDPIYSLIRSEDIDLSNWAARAIVKCRKGVTARLALLISSTDETEQVRLAAVSALQLIPSQESVEVLARLLDDSSATVSENAANSLCDMLYLRKPLDRIEFKAKILPGLKKLNQQTFLLWLLELRQKQLMQANENGQKLTIEVEKWRKQYLTAETDKFLTLKTPERMIILTAYATNQTEEAYRSWAAQRIAQWNRSALPGEDRNPVQILELVKPLLSDTSPRVRQLAVESLTSFTIELVRPTGSQLLAMLETEQSPEVQIALYNTLGAIEHGPALPAALASWQTSENRLVVAAAVKTLGRLAPVLTGDQVVQIIKSLASSAEAFGARPIEVRREVIFTIEILANNKDRADLIIANFETILNESLLDANAEIRSHAIYTMIKLKKKEILPTLLTEPLLNDPDSTIRFAVLSALESYGDSSHLDLLLNRYRMESDNDIKKQIIVIVTKLLSNLALDEVYRWSRPIFVDNQNPMLQEQILAVMGRRLDQIMAENKPLGTELPAAILTLQVGQAEQQKNPDAAVSAYLKLIRIASAAADLTPYRTAILRHLLGGASDKTILSARTEMVVLLTHSQPAFQLLAEAYGTGQPADTDQLYRRARLIANFIVPLAKYPAETLRAVWTEHTRQTILALLDQQETLLILSRNHDPKALELLLALDERFGLFPANGSVDERIVFIQNARYARRPQTTSRSG